MSHWTDILIRCMVKSTIYNHYLIRICSLDVDMNNAYEASLYCRRLESITPLVHIRCWKWRLCAAVFQRENNKGLLFHVCCWGPTSFFTEVLTVECSVVH